MEDEIGKCYILRKKHVPANEEVAFGMDWIKAPSESGTYTLYEELSVEMRHIRWIWNKEKTDG